MQLHDISYGVLHRLYKVPHWHQYPKEHNLRVIDQSIPGFLVLWWQNVVTRKWLSSFGTLKHISKP